jgi:hypothetical protein
MPSELVCANLSTEGTAPIGTSSLDDNIG